MRRALALRQRAPLDIVIPAATSVPSCLGAVKVWHGDDTAWGEAGATANLDSLCARRRTETVGRGGEKGFQVEQRQR
ncbi:MAG: hypothetical protein ACLPKW_30540, partial [Acetobacteraceae bacterium]